MAELENDIKLLKFPDNVRLRPGMYIGSTANPNVILREIIDNSIDELMLPNGTDTVKISVDEETGVCIIGDNGRGIPREIDKELGISKLELAMSYLHAGGKFSKGKAMSVGMNGVGSSATNALSSTFEVWSNGLHIVWNKGKKISEDEIWNLPEGFEDMVTVTKFQADPEIFDTIIPEIPTNNLKYTKLICKEIGKPNVHFIVNGVEDDSVLELPKFNVKYGSVWIDSEGNKFPYNLSVYFDWEIGRTYPNYDGTVNGVHTPDGYHVTWNVNQIKDYVSRKLGIHDSNLIKLGLNIFVCVMASEVSFDSQTKVRLSDIKGFDSLICLPMLTKGLDSIISENKELFDKLKASTDIYMDSVKRAQEVREIGGLLKGTVGGNSKRADRVKSKLSATSVKDCSTTNRAEAELYLCEGKSAGGTLTKARDSRIHSILPLRGRPLSVFNTGYQELLTNREWLNFVLTVGGGIDKLRDDSRIRYGKIIIAADADPDGMAIAISLLGGIATHMKFLIELGLVYVLETPLYLDTRSNTYYYLGEEDKVDFSSGKIRRFKGLGEFSPWQFKDFAFNPNKRRLIQVTDDNIENALDLIRNTAPKKQLMLDTGYAEDKPITEDMFDSITLQREA